MIFDSAFFTALSGTFLGGLLAFFTSLVIDYNRGRKELKNKSKKLLLIMMGNNGVIEKIKRLVDNDSISPEQKYNYIFGRDNFDYVIHPIDSCFADIQADLYKEYNRLIFGININLYYLVFDIVKMQSLIVNLQNNPVKDTDIQTKEKIIKRFERYYEQYKEKYNIVFEQKEIKKYLKK